jgi:hypothetical protein
MPKFDWAAFSKKAGTGALYGFLLLAVYDPGLVPALTGLLPDAYRQQAAFLLLAALPAVKNVLKHRFGVTFGGLL